MAEEKMTPEEKIRLSEIVEPDDDIGTLRTFIRYDHVKRNSRSETGMRILRRLEMEHGGFRSEKVREDFLRIYQAVKYLGWNVHRAPPPRKS